MLFRALGMLEKRNVIASARDPEPQISFFNDDIVNVLGERRKMALTLASNALKRSLGISGGKTTAKPAAAAAASTPALQPCFNALLSMHALGAEIDDALALTAVYSDVKGNIYESLQAAIADGEFERVLGDKQKAADLEYIFHALEMLSYDKAEIIVQQFPEMKQKVEHRPSFYPLILSLQALRQLETLSVDEALALAKEAVWAVQKSPVKKSTARVYRISGLVYFARNEISDALDYFSFAIDAARKQVNNDELVRDYYFCADAQFIYGNLSKALRLIDNGLEAAKQAGKKGWLERSAFLKARILFQVGSYEDAMSLLKNLKKDCTNNPERRDDDGAAAARKIDMLDAWIFRCATYIALPQADASMDFSTTTLPACPADTNAEFSSDMVLFQIENRCLAGDFRAALEKADNALSQEARFEDENQPYGHIVYLEQPDWSSGFSTCEIIQMRGKELWLKQIRAWRCFAQLMLNQAESAKPAILAAMKALLPQGAISTPANVLLHYLYYCMLSGAGVDEVDKNTALSLAFKQVQVRASRIDKLEIKKVYQNNQHWNSRLFQAAKENRLI
jgi:tetratricopeptide (TPR) repeat protein